MPRYRTAYPPEFRRQMVDLVRSGRTPEELAREFEPTAQSISSWLKQAERDAGKRIDGPGQALSGRNWGAFDVRTTSPASGARHPGKGYSLVRAGEQGEPERVYRFMSAHQAMYPIRTMARVAEGFGLGLLRLAEPTSFGSGDR